MANNKLGKRGPLFDFVKSIFTNNKIVSKHTWEHVKFLIESRLALIDCCNTYEVATPECCEFRKDRAFIHQVKAYIDASSIYILRRALHFINLKMDLSCCPKSGPGFKDEEIINDQPGGETPVGG